MSAPLSRLAAALADRYRVERERWLPCVLHAFDNLAGRTKGGR